MKPVAALAGIAISGLLAQAVHAAQDGPLIVHHYGLVVQDVETSPDTLTYDAQDDGTLALKRSQRSSTSSPAAEVIEMRITPNALSINSPPIFTMGPTACIRGPLTFFARDGSKLLELKEGEAIPLDCKPDQK